MASTIAKIAVSFSANTSEFLSGLTGMSKSTVKWSAGIKKDMHAAGKDIAAIGKVVGTSVVAMGAVVAVGILKSTNEIGKLVDEAGKIGVLSSELQALGYAAKTSGTDVETLKRSFVEVQKSVNDAVGGNKKTTGSFNTLSLSVDKIARMNPAQRFIAITDALSKVSDPAKRSQIGFDLLGKTFTEITPMIKDGAVGLRNATNEAAAIGQMLSTKDNQAVKDMAENFEWMGNLGVGAFNTISAAVAPLANDIISTFKSWITDGTNFRDTLLAIVNVFGTIALVVARIVDNQRMFIKIGLAVLSGIAGIIATVLQLAMKAVNFVIDGIVAGINLIIKAWNALPIGDKVEPINITFHTNLEETLGNIRQGSYDKMKSFGSEAGEIWKHGFSEKVGNVIGKIQDGITSVNQNAKDTAAKHNNTVGTPTQGTNPIAFLNKVNLTPTDAYSKVGLMTSTSTNLDSKKQTDYLRNINETLKAIHTSVRNGSPVAAFAN